MNIRRVLKTLLILSLSTTFVACQGNMESNVMATSFSSVKSENVLNVEDLTGHEAVVPEKVLAIMQEINTEEVLNSAIEKDIDKQLKKMKILKFLSILLAIPFKPTNDNIQNEKIKNPIKEFISGVTKIVDKAYALDDRLLGQLNEAASQLDSNIKSHQELLEKIDGISLKLDGFIEKIDNAVIELVSGVDGIISKINAKKNSTINPITRYLCKKGISYFSKFKADLEVHLN